MKSERELDALVAEIKWKELSDMDYEELLEKRQALSTWADDGGANIIGTREYLIDDDGSLFLAHEKFWGQGLVETLAFRTTGHSAPNLSNTPTYPASISQPTATSSQQPSTNIWGQTPTSISQPSIFNGRPTLESNWFFSLDKDDQKHYADIIEENGVYESKAAALNAMGETDGYIFQIHYTGEIISHGKYFRAPKKHCECGAEKTGSPGHSSWCPKL